MDKGEISMCQQGGKCVGNVDKVDCDEELAQIVEVLGRGGMPELEETVAVRNAMVRETDLRQPMDPGQQLLNSSGLSNNVGQAMVELLQVLEDAAISL